MKASRIAHEKKTVELMIRLYCRKKEKNTILCADCEELLRYAHVSTIVRLERRRVHARNAPYIVTNPSCANECDR